MEATGTNAMGQDVFLTLLTTQLKHQDPLEPMNGTEFVAQLAQFTQLEQTTAMNGRLEKLVEGNVALNHFGVAGLIGKEVKVEGDVVVLPENGGVELPYRLERDAQEVRVQIFNQEGQIVKTLQVTGQSTGLKSIHWDGRDQNGNTLLPGEFRFGVVAKDIQGNPVAARQYSQGEVSSVFYEGGLSYLLVNGQRVPATNIVSVGRS